MKAFLLYFRGLFPGQIQKPCIALFPDRIPDKPEALIPFAAGRIIGMIMPAANHKEIPAAGNRQAIGFLPGK